LDVLLPKLKLVEADEVTGGTVDCDDPNPNPPVPTAPENDDPKPALGVDVELGAATGKLDNVVAPKVGAAAVEKEEPKVGAAAEIEGLKAVVPKPELGVAAAKLNPDIIKRFVSFQSFSYVFMNKSKKVFTYFVT